MDGNAVFNGVVTGLAITLVVMVAVLIVLVASRMGKSQSAAPAPVEMAMTPASAAAAATAAATREGSEQPDLIHQESLPTNPPNQSYLQNARRGDCSQQRNASVAYLPTLAPPEKSVSTVTCTGSGTPMLNWDSRYLCHYSTEMAELWSLGTSFQEAKFQLSIF